MAGKRKRSVSSAIPAAAALDAAAPGPILKGPSMLPPPRPTPSKRHASNKKPSTNPDHNKDILDAPDALRASPDSDVNENIAPERVKMEDSDSPLSDLPEAEPQKKKKTPAKAGVKKEASVKEAKTKTDEGAAGDPEAEGEEEEADEEELKEALSRPPPVHSDYLPLPWKGRLGYACLCTYLRYSNPPVFSSRTCRIASILEHRHPLKDPSQPEHATKNRPDRTQPADEGRGKRYVEAICLANVKDISKMIRWNDKYGIKFLRLSSEMFPFASHEEYGYELAPFASEALAEAGKVVAELGHRVTTHPGQFTQLGSPRPSVIGNAFRDLAYHDEMLSLLQLPPQQNRDAVMILHMGGVFGDKAATLDRFRANYATLSPSVKARLVLENDDVSWSVHELLPVCEELDIPMVLDFHHHNIIFDNTQVREGTADVVGLFPRILATWTRKRITPKMHYSEPTPAAITGRQRRKHNPRVATLPPCPDNMDLMIEAKDKEQAVFELMRTFKLPGFQTFNDIVPHARADDNKFALQEIEKSKRKKATPKKGAKKAKGGVKQEDDDISDLLDDHDEAAAPELALVPDDQVGMGGPEGRVYWPPGMEDWLRPKKREVKKKESKPGVGPPRTPAQIKKEKMDAKAAAEALINDNKNDNDDESAVESDEGATPATKKAKAAIRHKAALAKAKATAAADVDDKALAKAAPAESKPKPKPKVKREAKDVPTPTPSTSDAEEELDEPQLSSDEDEGEPLAPARKRPAAAGWRQSGRAAKAKVNYADEGGDVSMDDA